MARLELGPDNYALRSMLDSGPAVAIPVFQLPGANALQLSDSVRAKMKELEKNFPEGVSYEIDYDPTIFVGKSVDSELSDNMIDLCPVGALTSKPFRYSARTWELSRRKSVSPHDSVGANLVVQVKNNRVMRVLPMENEAINECWISDKDRFSYEGLNSDERLTAPMLKQGGNWIETDWQTALEYVANGLRNGKRKVHTLCKRASPIIDAMVGPR